LDAESVATRLKSVGFETAAFHSNPYVSRAYSYEENFDEFYDDLYLGNSKIITLLQRAWDKVRNNHYARVGDINRWSLAWLNDRGDEPFFLWNHYMDVHGPYEPPAASFEQVHSRSLPSNDVRKLHQRFINDPESITEEER